MLLSRWEYKGALMEVFYGFPCPSCGGTRWHVCVQVSHLKGEFVGGWVIVFSCIRCLNSHDRHIPYLRSGGVGEFVASVKEAFRKKHAVEVMETIEGS